MRAIATTETHSHLSVNRNLQNDSAVFAELTTPATEHATRAHKRLWVHGKLKAYRCDTLNMIQHEMRRALRTVRGRREVRSKDPETVARGGSTVLELLPSSARERSD